MTDRDLIEDFIKLCNGEENYDKWRFYPLFHFDDPSYELEGLVKIFSYTVNQKELLRRYLNYKAPKKRISKSQLLELIQLDLENKREFCLKKGESELVDLMTDVNYSFVNKEEFRKLLEDTDLPQVTLMELIGDHQNGNGGPIGSIALKEAFYGLTGYNNLVWYLAKPLYASEFNPDPYFEVWKNSGDYILGNNEVYVLHKANLKMYNPDVKMYDPDRKRRMF